MINTTGIHSAGNQGLSQISSPPQEVDPQAEEQFKQMMLGTPNNPSTLADLEKQLIDVIKIVQQIEKMKQSEPNKYQSVTEILQELKRQDFNSQGPNRA